ncbi:transcription factor jumonji (jmj) family protein [Striga asiatica]|uniref:Transcription factor jumonji (Jmj) family protein n=1 Tax=Striga asiatica TaxID=4170 RepID=A0A5A7PMK0_STRAF|nr:transcription factor jumonji (jmj) family protein [Striga asiatica]
MLLIFTIDSTNASKKFSRELANFSTSAIVVGLVNRAWSEVKMLFLSISLGDGSRFDPAFFTLLCMGQTILNPAANEGFIDGSTSVKLLKLWILFWKDEQWEKPSVWAPVIPLTRTTASLAARAKMSAQETTPGHIFSTFLFAWSIT